MRHTFSVRLPSPITGTLSRRVDAALRIPLGTLRSIAKRACERPYGSSEGVIRTSVCVEPEAARRLALVTAESGATTQSLIRQLHDEGFLK